MNTRIYVEGGGDNNALRTLCRQGFSEFFRKAGLEGMMPRIIASGSRNNAFSNFCTALNNANTGDFIVLLVDAEGPVETEMVSGIISIDVTSGIDRKERSVRMLI